MHYFTFKEKSLYCETRKVSDLAKIFGTPLYVYSAKTILDHFYKIKRAFAALNPLICYSVKANSNLSIIKLLINHGAGLDIVSGGELYRARKVRCPAERIVYASVGKTENEIKDAIKSAILMFNVESLPELERIERIAKKSKAKVNISLRFNPDVEPKTHSYITTGKKETKFGMDEGAVKSIFLSNKKYPNLNIIGIHIHIGSQIQQAQPFVKAIKRTEKIVNDLKQKKIFLKYFNIGGGLGIVYDKERPQTANEFAKKVLPLLKRIGLQVILEPGRFIVGNAGILVTKVTYIKDTPQKRFVIVDAAMNDLARPSLYGSYHEIVPLIKGPRAKGPAYAKASAGRQGPRLADIVGPICESGDFLGKARNLAVNEGEYLAILGAGAYGFSMSSNYNSRGRAAEVLVRKSKACLIRKRETYKDLVSKEIVV
jgi:diaminopimelate decarboxylase